MQNITGRMPFLSSNTVKEMIDRFVDHPYLNFVSCVHYVHSDLNNNFFKRIPLAIACVNDVYGVRLAMRMNNALRLA